MLQLISNQVFIISLYVAVVFITSAIIYRLDSDKLSDDELLVVTGLGSVLWPLYYVVKGGWFIWSKIAGVGK